MESATWGSELRHFSLQAQKRRLPGGAVLKAGWYVYPVPVIGKQLLGSPLGEPSFLRLHAHCLSVCVILTTRCPAWDSRTHLSSWWGFSTSLHTFNETLHSTAAGHAFPDRANTWRFELFYSTVTFFIFLYDPHLAMCTWQTSGWNRSVWETELFPQQCVCLLLSLRLHLIV